MKLKDIGSLLKQTYDEWSADKAPRLGAALSYYTVFSIAPLLLIAIGIAGAVFGEEAARGEILGQVKDTIGPTAAQAVQDMLQKTHAEGGSLLATLIGIAVLLFGASGVFVQLQDALNTIWKVEPKPDRGVWGIVRDRFLSFTVVLSTGFLLLVSLVVSAALTALGKFFTPEALPGGTYLWQVINGLVSLGFVMLLFALIFKLLPDAKIEWRDVWVGALLTAVLFTVGKYLLGLYLGRSGATSVFGAAGALVVILVWVYYSSQLLLFGAEFTRVWAHWTGSPIEPADNAVRVEEAARLRQGLRPTTNGERKPEPPRERAQQAPRLVSLLP